MLSLNYLLKKRIGIDTEFEIQEYGIHKDKSCNCKCVSAEIIYNSNEESNFIDFEKTFGITLIEKEKGNEKNKALIEIQKSIIRNQFHKIYLDVFPNPEQYHNWKKETKSNVKSMLYIEKGNPNIQYKVIEDSLCEFCKSKSSTIEKALCIHLGLSIWKIVGTGCGCSEFKPFEPDELKEIDLLTLLLDSQKLDV